MSNCLKHLLPVAAVAAVVAFAMDVKVDYDHKTDIANYHTYCWLKAKASDSLWEDRIMQAVDRQLAARGLAKVPSGGDASVAAVGTTRQEPTFTTFYNGMPGWHWRGWPGYSTTTVDYDRVGTLVVDLFDTGTKKLVWRGVASDTLSSKPEKNDKKLDEATEKMFKDFPPKSRGL